MDSHLPRLPEGAVVLATNGFEAILASVAPTESATRILALFGAFAAGRIAA